MEIFIDESGTFTASSGWSVVCALVIPDKETGKARRALTSTTREWPRAPNGELKGGSLDADHLRKLVEILHQRGALLEVVAIDVSAEDKQNLEEHKAKQCEGITIYLTDEHHPQLVGQIWALRRTLEAMPLQLYVQSLLMSELAAIVVEHSTMYFSQRRPQELGKFRWTIDAKDPLRITTQEKWWKDTLGPLQESRSRRHPIGHVDDPDFDYSHFAKAFQFTKQLWSPNRPRELMTGYDIKKVMTDNIIFVDSRSDILIQSVDILTNFLRRVLIGKVTDPRVVSSLGRLQILQRPKPNVYQSLHILTLSRTAGVRSTTLPRIVRPMAMAGRRMFQKQRTRTSENDQTRYFRDDGAEHARYPAQRRDVDPLT